MNEDEQVKALLELVATLTAELHAGPRRRVALDSTLDRELGFDSLARVELLARCERRFGVSLPEATLVSAETPRDLLRAVASANGTAMPVESAAVVSLGGDTVGGLPEAAATLVEVLDWHVAAHGDRTHVVLVSEGGEEAISYRTLRRQAEALASGLQRHEVQPGQAVAIMLPTGREYFCSFYGVLLAGAVPLPIYPPARPSQLEDHLQRHAGILNNALVTLLISFAEAGAVASLLKLNVATLRAVVTVQELSSTGPALVPAGVSSQHIALLQYTSGSTGNPKGVVLSHANLLANIRAMGQAARAGPADVFVSWLPLYHDMGLIGAWLGSLYHAMPLVVMSPLTFLSRPERWLWAIHRHRGTLSAAPNFGYELCLRRIDDRALAGLDLSSWRMAFNGAEPVSPDTIENFQRRFADYGLRPEALAPVYGLAESAVGVTFPPPDRGPVIDRIRREAFERDGRALPAAFNETDALRFVGCGRPLPGHAVRVVDRDGQEVGERVEGRVELRGPSASSGYFRNPDETRHLFHVSGRDIWLDAGDLGYIADGELYPTGRAKDIIIRAGRNMYPYELEEAVGNLAGVRKGCVAAFGIRDSASGTERLVVLAETRSRRSAVRRSLRDQIQAVAVNLLGEPADDVVLVPPHSVLKTSSGKIRRTATRERYQRGILGGVPPPMWWQFTRLAGAGLALQLRRAMRAAGDIPFAIYSWLLFFVLGAPTWVLAAILPRPAWSWAASNLTSGLFVRLSRVPFRVRGLEKLPPGPCVVVANHASYLDGVLVVAASKRPFSFVAKDELREHVLTRVYLRGIGTEFVERFDLGQSVEAVKNLLNDLRGGRSLFFFAEGTFRPVPGLLPFRMGAFIVAAQAGAPVVPMSIRGTRTVLRDGHWLPRRGAISIRLGAPIMPEGSDWAAALKLRDRARAEILRATGEPDMNA